MGIHWQAVDNVTVDSIMDTLGSPPVAGVDFKRVFEGAPGLFLILRPDVGFTILGASDAFLRATYTQRGAIVVLKPPLSEQWLVALERAPILMPFRAGARAPLTSCACRTRHEALGCLRGEIRSLDRVER